jgi:lactate dehydrogenase-like 2-hydroxyacid dehydrogenase
MNDVRATALQLCSFSAELEAALNSRFTVVRWFELDSDAQVGWLADNAAAVRAVVTGGHVGCPNELIAALPSLGIITINGVGFDKVDLPFARDRNVRVTTTPDVLTDDVADLAVGLTIGVLRGLPAADAHVRNGHWPQGDRPLGRTVSGRRFGIVGLGRIGSAIAHRLAAFGNVGYTGRHPKEVRYIFYPDIIALAEASDVLVLACAASADTYRLVDASVLAALGANGYLINVARGSVVDEGALMTALEAGTIAGAGLDVFESEPNVPEALRSSGKVMLTPHIASATVETRRRMMDLAVANLDAFLAGTPLPTALV